ncbi:MULTISPECIES: hypothetical protein [unclassified Streptomyces]|uniref:hypothetical protein n=1 Tax=unclassified Streptomyces TaxID=2593676 RepID=UPI002E134CF0|nr:MULTISPECIES: hypothetical protein [unclassified Streptomyces]WSR23112.1 hypothetical protein OG573_30900 [Streptomyces sp. NBC_01205]
MAVEEKRAWSMLVVAVGSYATYLWVVLERPVGVALTRAPYTGALLWTVGLSIAASIAAHITIAAFTPKEANVKDQRDREIHRFGEYVGQSFVVIGGVAGLLLAMVEADPFWIANAIYLAFVLSSVLSSVVKVISYRFGFHPW